MALNERFTAEAEETEGAQSIDITNKEEYSVEGSFRTHLQAPFAGISGWSSKAIADDDALHETETSSTEVLVTLHNSCRDHNRNGAEVESTLASQDTIHAPSSRDLQPADGASAGEEGQDDVAEGKAANDTPSPPVERPHQLLGAVVSADQGSQSQRRIDDTSKMTEVRSESHSSTYSSGRSGGPIRVPLMCNQYLREGHMYHELEEVVAQRTG